MTPAERLEHASEAVHDAWAVEKRSQGWHHPFRECSIWGGLPGCPRCHPNLVPYADLPESAKELDRATVRAVAGVYETALAEEHAALLAVIDGVHARCVAAAERGSPIDGERAADEIRRAVLARGQEGQGT